MEHWLTNVSVTDPKALLADREFLISAGTVA
jgi:hypothetical protein